MLFQQLSSTNEPYNNLKNHFVFTLYPNKIFVIIRHFCIWCAFMIHLTQMNMAKNSCCQYIKWRLWTVHISKYNVVKCFLYSRTVCDYSPRVHIHKPFWNLRRYSNPSQDLKNIFKYMNAFKIVQAPSQSIFKTTIKIRSWLFHYLRLFDDFLNSWLEFKSCLEFKNCSWIRT